MAKAKRRILLDERGTPETGDRVPLLERDTEAWFSDERYDGQLAVDVYQSEDAIIIKSAIAGVKPEDIDIAVHREVVTIRGRREQHTDATKDDYLIQECYWGSFSRSIILPVEVDAGQTTASLKSGILTITLPKVATSGPRAINVQSDDENE